MRILVPDSTHKVLLFMAHAACSPVAMKVNWAIMDHRHLGGNKRISNVGPWVMAAGRRTQLSEQFAFLGI